MESFLSSLLAAFIVSAISFVGIFVLLKKSIFKGNFITALISFAAGTLLGDAFLHLIAEHVEEFGYEEGIMFVFLGIIIMLIIESYFHCSHDSTEEIEHHEHKPTLAKINLIGDGLHNLLDGMAIAASFLVSPAAGIASTVAIVLHEIPQEIADAAVLTYSGMSRRKVLRFNFLTALTAVVGVILAYFIDSVVEGAERYLVPLAAGQFIYIALADLLPEIHKKSGTKKYVLEIGAFILGIAVMYGLTLLE